MGDDAAIARRLFAATPAGWRKPGFERPLAGLLLYMVALLLLTGPYLWLTALLVPAHVQPFPAVDGALGPVDELLLLGWALGDFGITTAVIRAVAAQRTSAPARVLPHLRLLLAWQLVVGVAVAVASHVAAPLLEHTRYAPLAPALRFRAFTAPFMVFAALPALCESLQRYDRQLLLDLLEDRVLVVLLPIPFVLALRGAHDAGEPERALIGVVLGQGLAMALTAIVALVLIGKLGLPLRSLCRGALPTREEVGALLRFGAGIMSGKAVFFVAGLAELAIVVGGLPDYPTWLGVKAVLLGKLLQPMWLLWPFCETVVPSLSEALAAGKAQLARLYVVRYLQHGNLFVAALYALVVGAAPPLLVAYLPPAWHAAARLLPLAGLTGLLLPVTWVADGIQRACGRSGLNAGFLLGEQLVRLALLIALLPRLGLAGVFYAAAIAAALKSLATMIYSHRALLSLELPLRALLLGPLVAALAVGTVSRSLVALGLPLGLGALAFGVAAVVAFPLAYFVAGLIGAIEPAARAELDAARQLVPLRAIIGPFASLLARAAAGLPRFAARHDSALTHLAARERDELLARFLQANDMN